MVERFERFSYAISEISRCWHKIAGEEMQKYGLKGPHATYLLTVSRHKDGITAAKLCELTGKDKADVSRMTSILEKKGLVTREDVNQNSYRALIKLTEEGEKATEHVRARSAVAVEIAGSELSDEDRTIFYHALESIVSKLQVLGKEGLPQ